MARREVMSCDRCDVDDTEQPISEYHLFVLPDNEWKGDLCEPCLKDVLVFAKPGSDPSVNKGGRKRSKPATELIREAIPLDQLDPKTGLPRVKGD